MTMEQADMLIDLMKSLCGLVTFGIVLGMISMFMGRSRL